MPRRRPTQLRLRALESAGKERVSMRNGTAENERQVKDWLATQGEAMVKPLAELVNTDSGSYDKQGVDAAGEVLKRYFTAEGLPLETIAQPQYGEQIRAILDHPHSNDRR